MFEGPVQTKSKLTNPSTMITNYESYVFLHSPHKFIILSEVNSFSL